MNQLQAIQKMSNREPFKASALSAVTGDYYSSGRLSADERTRYAADRERITYTVLSYGTPIAWVTDNATHFVTEKFSVTTSKHQTYTRRGLR